MAKIELSDVAPKDAKSFSLANTNFEVPYETNDPVVLSNADAHPWLVVTREEVLIEGSFRDTQVKPEDDPLSLQNSVANDPDAVRAALEGDEADVTPLAVQSGLDQDEPETAGEGDSEVAVTLAADDTDSTKPARRRRSTSTDKDGE
jgi:hypothetical protein